MFIGIATGVVVAAAINRKTETERLVWDVLNAVVDAPWKRTTRAQHQQQGFPLKRAVARNQCFSAAGSHSVTEVQQEQVRSPPA